MAPFFRPTYIIAILVAVAVHECAHAWMAKRLGDATAEAEGRLTLNPLAHIDPLGALLFLIVGFGWAKPVPVDPRNFRHPKRDGALVALAGPASNFLLAFLAFVALSFLVARRGGGTMWEFLHISSPDSVFSLFLVQLLGSLLFVNLALMAFNLFPIAPLDGSRVLAGWIPLRYEFPYEQLQRRGLYILFGLLLFESFLPFPLLSGWVFGISDAVLGVFGGLVGIFM